MFLEQVLQRADCKAPRCENVWFAMPFCTDNQALSPRQARDHLQQRLRNDVSAGLGSAISCAPVLICAPPPQHTHHTHTLFPQQHRGRSRRTVVTDCDPVRRSFESLQRRTGAAVAVANGVVYVRMGEMAGSIAGNYSGESGRRCRP